MSQFNVVIVLDESGSMSSLGKEPENCLNNFIKLFKEKNEETKMYEKILFSLYRFGTNDPSGVTVSYKKIDIKDVPENHNFKPQNCTPLYDGIGMALTENKGTFNGIFHIITDGEENSSQKFNQKQVFEMIQDMENNFNWTFQYTGAGKNTYKVAKTLGIKANGVVQYDSPGIGYNNGIYSQSQSAVAIGFRAGNARSAADEVPDFSLNTVYTI